MYFFFFFSVRQGGHPLGIEYDSLGLAAVAAMYVTGKVPQKFSINHRTERGLLLRYRLVIEGECHLRRHCSAAATT